MPTASVGFDYMHKHFTILMDNAYNNYGYFGAASCIVMCHKYL